MSSKKPAVSSAASETVKRGSKLTVRRVEDPTGVHTTPVGLRCAKSRLIGVVPKVLVTCKNQTERTHRVFVDVVAFGYSGIPTMADIKKGFLLKPSQSVLAFTLNELYPDAALRLVVSSEEV